MKYYKAVAKQGHMGVGNYLEVPLYIKARTIIEAMVIAKKIPSIQHSKYLLKLYEITQEEYCKGISNRVYYENIRNNKQK